VINNECFNKAISDVNKAVSSTTLLPILSGSKIVANHKNLTLIGSNSDIVIEKVIPLISNDVKVLEVFETGSVVVSGKFLSSIAKKLPNDIHITVNEAQMVTIQSADIVTNLNGFSSKQYPNIPQIDLIKQTAFAVSSNESRPILTGVNMLFKENHLSFIATNSHRLALREFAIETNINGSYIIPGTSLNDLIKLINSVTGEIRIYITDSYIMFKSTTISLFSRLIEGNYPNISGLLPKNPKTIISLNTKQLLKGIDRACLFASEWNNNNVNLEIHDGNKIRISSNSTEMGKIEETQNITLLSGKKELSISLDGSFLIDALKETKEEEIRISFGGTMKPVLIEPIISVCEG
jgi:DNA polymerase III subunit beta